MSFFTPPARVKRMANDRAIAEADLSHLKPSVEDLDQTCLDNVGRARPRTHREETVR